MLWPCHLRLFLSRRMLSRLMSLILLRPCARWASVFPDNSVCSISGLVRFTCFVFIYVLSILHVEYFVPWPQDYFILAV